MRRQYTTTQLSLAEQLFAYLALVSPAIQETDAIWGFGHFDLKIPRRCGELHTQGYAQRIIFSGGSGSGTADLGQSEALAFQEELNRYYPQIPPDALVLENSSTNTGENVAFTVELMKRICPELAFERGIHSATLVANAYRQRRVWLTCRKHLPTLTFVNAPPVTAFEQECCLFADKNQKFPELLLGEIERLQHYAEADYIVTEPIPDDVYQCYIQLRDSLRC